MSRPTGRSEDRRFGDFFLALTCLVALGLIAVALTGGGGALTSDTSGGGTSASVEQTERVDRPGLVGGGSLGGADRNPVGSGVDGESNPFQNQSAELQFVVETSQPNYWRIDAYDEYANGSWVRTGTYSDYDAPLAPEGSVTEEVPHQITLHRNGSVLPSPWQPARLTAGDDSGLAVSPTTGLHALSVRSAGDSYTLSSYQYDPDLRQLRSARANYPSSIQQRYTNLPDDVPNRVTTLSDEITADSETPAEAACLVTDWIAENTTYDRDGTHQPGTDPVDQFLFEMDGGTAEYSASSMVVLLRSQDIPARYVTGYSPGEAFTDAEDTYGVRAVNAHAWAEVYVTGHGWIPFDPTAEDERLAVENAAGVDGEMTAVQLPSRCADEPAAESASESDDDSSTGTGDGTGTGTGNGDGTGSGETTGTESGDETDTTPPDVNITTTPDPLVVGGEASVEALLDDEAISGAAIRLADQHVGTTSTDGSAAITVPADLEDGQTQLTVQDGDTEYEQLVTVGTFRLTTDAERILALPGQETTVRATVGSTPIENVSIRHEGAVVGTTDSDGTANVSMSAAPRMTLTASYVGQEATTEIENQLMVTTLLGVGVIGLLSGLGVVATRRAAVVESTRSRASSVSERLFTAFIEFVSRLEAKLGAIQVDREWNVGGLMWALIRSPSVVARGLWSRRPDSIRGAIVGFMNAIYRTVVLLVRSLRGSSPTATPHEESTESPTAASTSSATDDRTTSVRTIWTRFVRLAVRQITPTHTPGEIARTAIEKGFPRQPVLRLTNAFRATVYGPQSRPESLTDEATSAMELIETTDAPTDADQGDDHSTGGRN